MHLSSAQVVLISGLSYQMRGKIIDALTEGYVVYSLLYSWKIVLLDVKCLRKSQHISDLTVSGHPFKSLRWIKVQETMATEFSLTTRLQLASFAS